MPRRIQFSLFKLLLLTLLLGELIYGVTYLANAYREEAIGQIKGERSRLRAEVYSEWQERRTVSPGATKRITELDDRLKRLEGK